MPFSKIKFEKPPLTIEEQLDLLIARGMVIENLIQAEKFLANVGYYRLSGYWKVFEDKNNTSQHKFALSINFKSIIQLYNFDRNLRLTLIEALEKIEIAIKSYISNYMALAYGAFWYLEANNFKDEKCTEIKNLIINSKSLYDPIHKFIEHYEKKYYNPSYPPSWMIFETSPRILKSWLRSITTVRNICAHHGRIFNRDFTILPEFSKELSQLRLPRGKLGEQLFILTYLLKKINLEEGWINKIEEIMNKNLPNDQLYQVGLTPSWKNSFKELLHQKI